jgi:hypothetical protein
MKRVLLLTLVWSLTACGANVPHVAGPAANAAPALKSLDLWTGDWTLKGTAKDTPTSPEYQLVWRMRGRWILDGHAVEIQHDWRGAGPPLRALEILAYDLSKRTTILVGFGDDGTTWLGEAHFEGANLVETGSNTLPDGRVFTFRNTWIVAADRMSVSGRAEQTLDGVTWTGFAVTGTRAKRGPR